MILVTGASGYIGSHFLVEIIKRNEDYLAVDNFSRSDPITIDKIQKITNKKVNFFEGDIGNEEFLKKIFSNNNIKKVVHFAGFKSIKESINYPLNYYINNVLNTMTLINSMENFGIKNIIFSSTATVYGGKLTSPINEDSKINFPENSYAQSKYMIEQVLKKMSDSNYKWNVGILRYFNPIGCHSSGIIGENNNQNSSNLIPALINVILKVNPCLEIYGNNYNTRDGTGIRDYLHIEDLVKGHLSALNYLEQYGGFNIWNLGSGRGYSVLEILNVFESEMKYKIPIIYKPRRLGDVDEYWADVSKAKIELSWQAEKNLSSTVRDIIRYIKR